jgi:hypothetical protein
MKARFIATTLVCAGIFGGGCSDAGNAPKHEKIGSNSQAFTKTVDLISPATCVLKNNKLSNCAIKTQTFSGAAIETAVPLRTTIYRTVKGNCVIKNMDLAVKFTAASTPTVAAYRYMTLSEANDQVVMRRKGGLPITSLTMTDVGLNTAVTMFPADCKVSLKIVTHELDVDTTEDAQQIIADLEADVQKKVELRESYEHLVQFSGAFTFLKAVADSFRIELTNETIQELRAKASSAVGSIALLSSTCDDMMTDEDRENMMLLMLGLPQLGAPEDWSNPDGSPKTLEEFMGADSAAIYQTVDKLVKANALSSGQTYENLYKQAALDAERARAKLELAKAQLADWL